MGLLQRVQAHELGMPTGTELIRDAEADTAIELMDVHKRFGARVTLDGLRLRVPQGLVFGFLGPNGAGKTTTIRILLGLARPDRGSVRVFGLDPLTHAKEIRALTGVLLENDGLYDRLSAWRNLDYHGRIHHLPDAARRGRIQELLERMRLWDRRKDLVALWSKGMRQRLAIARALLHRPRLVLLDEPFSGLDAQAAVELRREIEGLARDEAMTIFLTSHDLGHVEKICSQVAMLVGGRIVATGRPDGLLAGSPGSLEDAFLRLAAGEGQR